MSGFVGGFFVPALLEMTSTAKRKASRISCDRFVKPLLFNVDIFWLAK